MTTRTSFNIREVNNTFSLPAGDVHVFQFTRFHVRIIELEDLHFHFDSAVLLADFDSETPTPDAVARRRVTALAILAECLREIERNPTELLLVAGHADTSGDATYNLTLSQLRADNTLFALNGNREEWIRICLAKHKVEDYQLILKWIARDWGFDCDPGNIDNVQTPQTTEATRKFQRRFNSEFSRSIGEDGIVGHDTWGAFFDVYMEELKEILEVDDAGLAVRRARLKFVDAGKRSVGCGENFPIESRGVNDFRSRINRRVEILFFTPPELPILDCHPARARCLADRCEVNRPRIFAPTVIPVPPVPPRVVRLIPLSRLEFHPVRPVPPDATLPPRPPVAAGTPSRSNGAGTTVNPTDPINIIPNPSVIPILTPTEATNQTAARIEFTFVQPSTLDFTDDDPRLTWTSVTLSGAPAVSFLDGKNTGLKVFVFGTAAGEVRLDVTFRGSVVASYRALVRAVKQIPCRFNILNENPVGRSAADAATPLTTLRSTPANIRDHLAICNRFLRQMGLALVLDTNTTVTDGATATAVAGIFTILVQKGVTFRVDSDGTDVPASKLNFRGNVMNFAYIHSETRANVGGVAMDFPDSTIAPATPGARPTITDSGTPSTSWRVPTGIPPDVAATPAVMTLITGIQRRDAAGAIRFPTLFSMIVCETLGDPSVLANQQAYAKAIVHELGHVLNLGHRVEATDTTQPTGLSANGVFFDGLTHPPTENIMNFAGVQPDSQDLDIIQTLAAHRSRLVPP